jgi:hypothetical protein
MEAGLVIAAGTLAFITYFVNMIFKMEKNYSDQAEGKNISDNQII